MRNGVSEMYSLYVPWGQQSTSSMSSPSTAWSLDPGCLVVPPGYFKSILSSDPTSM